MAKKIIGVMGPGEAATDRDKKIAYELGRLIAQHGWVLLTGGRNSGVMQEASRGAKDEGGFTIGILPTTNKTGISPFIDIPILTGMGNARNNINVLSSDVIIFRGMSPGTLSEAALALKNGKNIILVHQNKTTVSFFQQFDIKLVHFVINAKEAIGVIKELI